jgi:hypothetical protein
VLLAGFATAWGITHAAWIFAVGRYSSAKGGDSAKPTGSDQKAEDSCGDERRYCAGV